MYAKLLWLLHVESCGPPFLLTHAYATPWWNMLSSLIDLTIKLNPIVIAHTKNDLDALLWLINAINITLFLFGHLVIETGIIMFT